MPVPREEPDVPDYALQTGEVLTTEGRYVPLQALEKFTHTYVEAPDRNKVSLTITPSTKVVLVTNMLQYCRSIGNILKNTNSMRVAGICKYCLFVPSPWRGIKANTISL